MRGMLVVATALAVGLTGVACDGGAESGPPGQAAAPTFSPPGGAYEIPQSVTLSSTTPGATIHVTEDGSTPSRASAVAVAPLLILETTTVRAMAVADGYADSAVASATYTITPRPPPVVTITSGAPAAMGLLASQEIAWQSDQGGTFVAELGGTGVPHSGTVLATGSVAAGAPVAQTVRGTQLTYARPTSLWIHVTGGTGVLGSTSAALTLKPRVAIPIGGELGGVAVLPGGHKAYVVRRDFDDVAVIDADPASPTAHAVLGHVAVGARPLGIAATPDGARLYVTNNGSTAADVDSISALSASSDTVLATVSLGAQSSPNGIAVTPDGKRAYFARFEGVVSVLDVDPASPTYHAVTASIPHGRLLTGAIAVTPDGARAVLNWQGSGHGVDVIDVDPASASYHAIVASPVPVVSGLGGDVAVTSDGHFAFATDASERLCRIDLGTSAISTPGPWSGQGFIALTPDGTTLLTGNAGSPALGVVDASDLSPIAEVPMGGTGLGFAGGIAITADGARAYVTRDPVSAASEVVMVPLR